jgi:hypothetical protein
VFPASYKVKVAIGIVTSFRYAVGCTFKSSNSTISQKELQSKEPIKNTAPAKPRDAQAALQNEQYNRVTFMIQNYVESIGLTKEKAYNPKNNNWIWKNGSATIEVFIQTINFDNGGRRDYLRIFSPLLEIPTNNLLNFYRHLLELNDKRLGVKLCIAPNTQTVYATYERDIRGMDYQELTTCIIDLELWADELDDQLKAQFPNWSN